MADDGKIHCPACDGGTPRPPAPGGFAMGGSQRILDKNSMDDPVNNPSHYNQQAVETIEVIRQSMTTDEFQGYLRGSILKYLNRYRYKGQPVEDLRKSRWYLERLIEEIINDKRPYDNP